MTTTIEALLQRWTDAERSGDRDTLDRLLTDDFVGIGPAGFMLGKAAWLERLGPDLRYDHLELADVTSRSYGDAAIVVGHQRAAGEARGNAVPADTRVSFMVVAAGGDERRIAGIQYSFMVSAPGPGQ